MNSLKKEIRKTSNTNSWILLLVALIMLAVSYAGGTIAAQLVCRESDNYRYILKAVGMAAQYLVVIPAVLVLFHRKLNAPIGGCFCKPQMPGKWIAKWVFISLFLVYGMSYISNTVFTWIQSMSGVELHPIDFSSDDAVLDQAVNLISIAILAPFFEELLFRAALFQNAGKHGAWSMVIVVGCFFGLYHVNYEQILYTSVLGICACFLVAKTKSIYPSLIVHIVMNLIAGIQSVAGAGIDLEKVAAQDMEYIEQHVTAVSVLGMLGWLMIFITVVGGILFVRELIKHRDSFYLECEVSELSGTQKAMVYLTAPVTVVLIIFLVVVTIGNALM